MSHTINEFEVRLLAKGVDIYQFIKAGNYVFIVDGYLNGQRYRWDSEGKCRKLNVAPLSKLLIDAGPVTSLNLNFNDHDKYRVAVLG